jgi:streptomycin 6-kinase
VANSSIHLSTVVLAKAAVDGDGGRRWAAALPGIVADLEAAWSVRIGTQLDGGTSAYVARAVTAAGDDAVVKIAVPAVGFAREVHTLDRADGRGYVRLLAADLDHQAMLLEPLGVSMNRVGYEPERQLAIVAAVLPQVWALPLTDRTTDRPTDGEAWAGAPVDKAADLHRFIGELWEQLDFPCPEPVVARALEFAEDLSHRFAAEQSVVLHGDAATANLLQVPAPRPGAEAGFVFVDPSTFVGDPAYDLGVALRDWCAELLAGDAPALARHWCRRLADACHTDEAAVWRWAYLERVSTGLYVQSLGGDGRPHLMTAELLCDAGPDSIRA